VLVQSDLADLYGVDGMTGKIMWSDAIPLIRDAAGAESWAMISR
jgi:hypothetical protein